MSIGEWQLIPKLSDFPNPCPSRWHPASSGIKGFFIKIDAHILSPKILSGNQGDTNNAVAIIFFVLYFT